MTIPTAHGPDIYHGQKLTGEPIDPTWQLFSHKCSEGAKSGDPTFLARWDWAHEQTFKYRGAYHWLRSDSTIRDQADNFLARIRAAGGLGRGDFVQLDWEVTPNIPLPTSTQAFEWADRINNAVGREIVITYTGTWLPDSPLDSDTRREYVEWREENPDAPLWLAFYNTSTFAWSTVTLERADLWQFTSRYHHPSIVTLNANGIDTGFDMNTVLNFATLDRLTDQVPPPPPPPPPPAPIPEPTPLPPPIPPEDDMTLYAARDASGTVHIGDGVTRRALHDAAVYSTMIYRGGAKTGPQILDVRGQPAPGNPALLSIENPVVLESLGQLI